MLIFQVLDCIFPPRGSHSFLPAHVKLKNKFTGSHKTAERKKDVKVLHSPIIPTVNKLPATILDPGQRACKLGVEGGWKNWLGPNPVIFHSAHTLAGGGWVSI